MERVLRLLAGIALMALSMSMEAQRFFDLTAEEVRIDSLLPVFNYEQELGSHYADSVYSVAIEYPEFIDMSATDVTRYQRLTSEPLPEMPVIHQYVGVARKQGTLYVSFAPLVFRDGRYQKLVSFKLNTHPQPLPSGRGALARSTEGRLFSPPAREGSGVGTHSILATGTWAKIRVPKTGIYQLTDALIRKAGFTDLSKVKVYGYGGALQPEKLSADYLAETDDLQEVPTCTVGGRRLFHATGPVGWSSSTALVRTRNPYSDYGYYFLTEESGDGSPLTVDAETFVNSFYPSPDDYHTLYEVDDYAWYHGGRNLFDSRTIGVGQSRSYTLAATSATARLIVVISYDAVWQGTIAVNGQQVGVLTVGTGYNSLPEGRDSYSKGATKTWTFNVDNLQATNDITITQTSGSDIRLDYLSFCFSEAAPLPDLASTTFDTPEYVYNITNQDHHADGFADMIIIIPTSQKLLSQAQRLKQLHEERDGLRVNIVPADELFNEFSSGTPDANAYRRYLKMLYDRAETDADMPRFLLLMGDGAWDNRMLSSNWQGYSPDDFLLCFESENSFSETDCYVTDDFFCMLDEGEGASLTASDKGDVAVGRLPARTEEEAKIMVDKIMSYTSNEKAGDWQNTLCFMGDDGDYNRHMGDAEAVASMVQKNWPDFQLKRIYWDAYQRTSSATGFSYPDVTTLIRQQMQSGALMMNYTGHGAPYTMSHEQVVHRSDFELSSGLRLPLWLTASCDIMPFDGQEENIGETAMLNATGGAIAFYGTTRTVYAHYNRYMNLAFTEYVLGSDANGRRYTIGEAARLAKNRLLTSKNDIGNDYTANKLQYTLLGDPALQLAVPTARIVIDSINGVSPANGVITLKAGHTVTVRGHVADHPSFNGVVTLATQDVEQLVTCRMNSTEKIDTAFCFRDRLNTLYRGSDSVRAGQFALTFALPKDISYTDGTGMMKAYAVNSDKSIEAHGLCDAFTMTGDAQSADDGIGPNIWCYLNSPQFTNGGSVNTTPYFYAELADKDGINASGSGIGHDLELTIWSKVNNPLGQRSSDTSGTQEWSMVNTYNLNSYFQYDFGDYRSGSLGFSIPKLDYGEYRLLLRVWDVQNNSSTAELTFNVVNALEPNCFSVTATKNPATTSTTFIINHDRTGSLMDVELDIYDTSGRLLWRHTESGVSADNAYTIDWDLCTDGGRRLQTGVYLYRVAISSDGSSQASQAKKLIVLSNK